MSETTGKMHAADLARSGRLQQTLRVLADRQWHTTLEIRERTDSCAVHSDISELRAEPNGFVIERRYDGKSDTGRRVYAYRLVGVGC